MTSFFDDEARVNEQILGSVADHEVPENAEIVFENHFQDTSSPKSAGKKKRILIMLAVITVVLGGGYVIAQKKQAAASNPNPSDAIEQAAASAASGVQINTAENIAIAPTNEQSVTAASSPIAGQSSPSVPSVDHASLDVSAPAKSSIASTSAKSEVITQPVLPPPVAPKTASSPVKKDAGQDVRITRKTPDTEPLIVARNKTVQTVLMRNMSVVAIMTDGLIMRKGDENVEVSIGDTVPGWGVIQRTNPRDKTVETDEKIFKFN